MSQKFQQNTFLQVGRPRSKIWMESRAHQKEESSCLFDGVVKGLFMFISHLKRSHKTGDRAHELSTGHKSSRETEHVRKSTSIRVPRIEENRSLAMAVARPLSPPPPPLASSSSSRLPFEDANESFGNIVREMQFGGKNVQKRKY